MTDNPMPLHQVYVGWCPNGHTAATLEVYPRTGSAAEYLLSCPTCNGYWKSTNIWGPFCPHDSSDAVTPAPLLSAADEQRLAEIREAVTWWLDCMATTPLMPMR